MLENEVIKEVKSEVDVKLEENNNSKEEKNKNSIKNKKFYALFQRNRNKLIPYSAPYENIEELQKQYGNYISNPSYALIELESKRTLIIETKFIEIDLD